MDDNDRENELLDALSVAYEDEEQYKGRIRELEGKVRTRAYRDAFDRVADKLGIPAEHRDDVFDLAKFTQDADEPDPKKMGKHLREWIAAKPARQRFLDASEDEEEPELFVPDDDDDGGDDDDEDEAPPAPKAKARGVRAASSGRFAYTSDQLSDQEWMGKNGVAYANAIENGTAVKVG